MLVLTRKRSEVIHIGDEVLVKVIRTSRGSVKIGIEAPAHVRVLRGELCGDAPPTTDAAEAELSEAEHGPMALACSDQFPYVPV